MNRKKEERTLTANIILAAFAVRFSHADRLADTLNKLHSDGYAIHSIHTRAGGHPDREFVVVAKISLLS